MNDAAEDGLLKIDSQLSRTSMSSTLSLPPVPTLDSSPELASSALSSSFSRSSSEKGDRALKYIAETEDATRYIEKSVVSSVSFSSSSGSMPKPLSPRQSVKVFRSGPPSSPPSSWASP